MVEEATAKSEAKAPSAASPVRLKDLDGLSSQRLATHSREFNGVLGGGVVPGSTVLVGGDPGIGKSTLLLQAATSLADGGIDTLYVSGEESLQQIRQRASRLGLCPDSLLLLGETDADGIERCLRQVGPRVVVIDSIQTLYDPVLSSAPGSVGQVRHCAGRLISVARSMDIAIFLVGHVTKSGELAGPRVLEHMVDTVLYFEGERHHAYRMLRAVKNRFGSTNELGLFDMTDRGLIDVTSPSQLLLSERPQNIPGSVVVAVMEGSRSLLVEVQALIAPSAWPSPRRTAMGIDQNRLALLLAVLERKMGLVVSNQDAYVKVAGGLRVDEPGADLGIALALVSSYLDAPLDDKMVVIGEVGLTGEVRMVSGVDQRLREAEKLGFSQCMLPAHVHKTADIGLIPVANLEQAMTRLGLKKSRPRNTGPLLEDLS